MESALRITHGGNLNTNNQKDYRHKRSLEPKEGVLFTDFILTVITQKKNRKGEKYYSGYVTVINKLKEFEKVNDVSLYTNSITEEFLDDFIIFLEDQNLMQSYIQKIVISVKSMAGKAGKYGYAVDPSYDMVSVENYENTQIALSLIDLGRIYHYKGLSRIQEKTKNIFIIGCLTALRFSDYSSLTPVNFSEDMIVKVTKKTESTAVIPQHEIVREIFKKYGNQITYGRTIQQFDRMIKIIMRKIGFTEPVLCTYKKGGKIVTETKERWQLITSHTCRRTMITIMASMGYSDTDIMAISTHKDIKTVQRYKKITQSEMSNKLKGSFIFKK